jgi:hypothetical protein
MLGVKRENFLDLVADGCGFDLDGATPFDLLAGWIAALRNRGGGELGGLAGAVAGEARPAGDSVSLRVRFPER